MGGRGQERHLQRQHTTCPSRISCLGLTLISMCAFPFNTAGAGYLRVRNVSYTKKLNIPLPLAPERCQVWEEHRLLAKDAGGWVVLLVCTNDAPKGDCFEAHVQICGLYVDRNTSKLRVSMQVGAAAAQGCGALHLELGKLWQQQDRL